MRGRLPDSLPLGALERFRDFLVMPSASILRPRPNSYRLVARSDGLHVVKWDGTDVGPLAGALASGRSAVPDFSSSSGTFVDLTGASVTLTTGARRCLVGYSGRYYGTVGSNDYIENKLLIDGTAVPDGAGGTADGTFYGQGIGVSTEAPISFIYLTDVLSAGAHTIKLQVRNATGARAFIAGRGYLSVSEQNT